MNIFSLSAPLSAPQCVNGVRWCRAGKNGLLGDLRAALQGLRRFFGKRQAGAVGLLLLCAAPAWAQDLPDVSAIEERNREHLQRLDESRRLSDPNMQLEQAPVPQPLSQLPGFYLNSVEFSASRVLTAEELRAVAADYENGEIDFERLQELINRINGLYQTRGFSLFRAVIPPQTIKEGVLKVRLIEIEVGEVLIEGNRNIRPDFLAGHIGLDENALLDADALAGRIWRLRRAHGVKARADLLPGKRVGSSDVRVLVEEPARYFGRISFDGHGSPRTGRERISLQAGVRDLFGIRDDLSLYKLVSRRSDNVLLSYRLGINHRGGTMTFSHTEESSQPKGGVLRSLIGLKSQSETSRLDFNQPFIVGKNKLLNVFVGLKKRELQSKIGSVKIADTRSKTLTLGVNHESVGVGWYSRLELSRHSGYEEAVAARRRKSFQLYRASMIINRRLTDALSGLISLTAQRSKTLNVPSVEQMSAGGEGSVRGFDSAYLTNDQGEQLSLELSRSFPGTAGMLDGFAFVDYATLRPTAGGLANIPHRQTISATGVGLLLQPNKATSFKLTYAKPVKVGLASTAGGWGMAISLSL